MITYIISAKVLGQQETVDLEIASKDHNFYANGIVVSNSHACSYAMIAYWCLFLKTHFPAQFMCSLFNSTDQAGTDKQGNTLLSRYVKYSRKRGIEIKPPDVNTSKVEFTLESANVIRWGLGKVKGLGPNTSSELIKTQPYESFEDFYARISKQKVNKTKVEALIKCGAMDCFGDRLYLFNKYYGELRKDKNFEGMEYTEDDSILNETDMLGICLSHEVLPPIEEAWMKKHRVIRIEDFENRMQGVIIGRVKDIKEKQSKSSGKDMLLITLHDDSDDITFFVWEKDIETVKAKTDLGNIMVFPLKKFDDGGACFYSGPETKLVALSTPNQS